jgi:hypothetical protein
MKVKASELQGEALDRMVAHCVEWSKKFPIFNDGEPMSKGNYSTDWALAGPIIERERIATWFERYEDEDAGLPCWFAAKYGEREYPGPTLLIAGMRCYVASKLGDEIEVPDELMEA